MDYGKQALEVSSCSVETDLGNQSIHPYLQVFRLHNEMLIDAKYSDPTVGGQATVGEVWRFTELPTLMRNLNINQIISFYKDGDQFKTTLEWDVNVVWPSFPDQ